VIGLLILSIGSDLPEIAVAVDAGIKGLVGRDASGVVVGTSIGSVVAQIGLVLGLAALINVLVLPRAFIVRHGAVLLGATALLAVFALDGLITRLEGLVLALAYGAYVIALMNGETVPDRVPRGVAAGGWKSWLALAAGLAVVIGSSELTVATAVSLARAFDVSEGVIAVLIIGLGTSLPELSISISAILKRRTELSVGNIIGSNVLDTLLPIGIAAMIAGTAVERHFLVFDLPFVFVLTIVVLAFFLGRRGVTRPEGLVILGLYAAYVAIKLTHI
jgi:cation:H+ antiporter